MARPTKTERIKIAERRNKAIAMRAAGQTWDAIAVALDYGSRGAACQDVARAHDQRIAEQHDGLDHLRDLELEHLDALRRRMVTVAEQADDEMAMKAVDRLVKIGERRAKLQGIDAPVKVDQGGTLRYEIVGVPSDAHR